MGRWLRSAMKAWMEYLLGWETIDEWGADGYMGR